jgi:hypothetical protein
VGDAERLTTLCQFVGDQMCSSFVQNGLAVPPWRNMHSLLSKWNVGPDRSCSPERGRPARAPSRPPTSARRSMDSSRATTAAAAAAAQAAQFTGDTAPVTVPWVSR